MEALTTIMITVMPLVATSGTTFAISRPTAVVVMITMPVSAMPIGMEVTTRTVSILPTAMAIPVGIPVEAAVAILTVMPVSAIVTVEPVVPSPAEGPLAIPVLGTTLFAAFAVMVVEVAGTVTS